MRISKYRYQDPEASGWNFSEVRFNKINLLVGNSGMGKTRLLNTIFNLGSQISHKEINPGIWDLELTVGEATYWWQIKVKVEDDLKPNIAYEKLVRFSGKTETIIVDRKQETFLFKGVSLPKLSRNESSISLLKEEDEIQPLYLGFSRMLRRRFFEADLSDRCRVRGFPFGYLERIAKITNLSDLYPTLHKKDHNLNSIIYVLSKGFNPIYRRICDAFMSVFSFITEAKVLDIQEFDEEIKPPGQVPIFCIKEKGVKNWIPLNELSSGMQKVLLILTDIFTLPEGSIYLVDEYENSLGVNAINFFPELLFEQELDIQFIIATHHPYIINKIPINNWYVFFRKGPNVKILYGDGLRERFSKSKQQAFIKLLNDPFFTEGLE